MVLKSDCKAASKRRPLIAFWVKTRINTMSSSVSRSKHVIETATAMKSTEVALNNLYCTPEQLIFTYFISGL